MVDFAAPPPLHAALAFQPTIGRARRDGLAAGSSVRVTPALFRSMVEMDAVGRVTKVAPNRTCRGRSRYI
ncbi:hypothetical protein [Sphingomonas faeni]|uniref:hypothetical protein n=1 Tax=Sphingomonas faeni TaxID=185950 RepID=UPI0020C765AB|nr:hypothetical protein [Sphingomonas faeni]MCP8891241.1 hypothetical protein [Sphingomonas faeni]